MFNRKAGLVALLMCLTYSNLFAGTLTSYSIGDVLLCFRKSGGANDMVVDLGPVSGFTNVAPNTRINITQYTGNQLAAIGTNNVIWSAFAWYDSTVTLAGIQWTLFASNPRTSLNTQTTPVTAFKQSAQHQCANTMVPVPIGAKYMLTNNYSALGTSTAAIEADNTSTYLFGQSYSFAILQGGDPNFNGDYQGYPENTTPSNFTTAGTVQRSDFYILPPGDGLTTPGVFLGYFELNTNGLMSYVAYPAAVAATPVIQSITRTNNVTYVKFTTGSSGTYTLRGTNILAGPVTNWPAITSNPGTGSSVILQDTSSAAAKFYSISAQ